MHLWCEFHISRPMFAEAQLDGLQSVINALLPVWSNSLRVAKHEDSHDWAAVGRQGRLHDSIHGAAPPNETWAKLC